MTFTQLCPPSIARAGGALAAALCLMAATPGCGSGTTPGGSGGMASARPTSSASPSSGKRAGAAAYLAIAVPANHRLETEVDGFIHHERDDLAAAQADLRAQAATERGFDRRLMKIAFPPQIAAVARALVRANQSRIKLTRLQARSASLARMRSYNKRHKVADAAVEIQVRIIRADLGLPPPSTS